jgi:hypothetical protein
VLLLLLLLLLCQKGITSTLELPPLSKAEQAEHAAASSSDARRLERLTAKLHVTPSGADDNNNNDDDDDDNDDDNNVVVPLDNKGKPLYPPIYRCPSCHL